MSNLSCGIIGLPNVGKSTIFRALTKRQVPAENYPFCTIDPNIGVVELKDTRLNNLAELSKSKKIVYASVSFVDIAGLVKGASKGEGLGNKFLSNIRETDAIVHVVRCFEDDDVIHVEGKIDPIKDIETINLELSLADLQLAENAYQKMKKQASSKETMETLEKVKNHLDKGLMVRTLELTDEEKESISHLPFLTNKKVIYVANVNEEDLLSNNQYVQQVKDFAKKENNIVLPICAKIEGELSQLSENEALEYLNTLGLDKSGLDRLISVAFESLGLITFLTTGEMETKAWTIKNGTNAATAAGKIHTDIEKGFIKAEVVSYNDMIFYKGRVGAREAGKARFEGKNYLVQDGDVILFFHN